MGFLVWKWVSSGVNDGPIVLEMGFLFEESEKKWVSSCKNGLAVFRMCISQEKWVSCPENGFLPR
ncbi:hypothetical protein J14TS2_01180 [Bacillus sp. J14TS2]|uniref:hypothetical protein n=1 Tax=Bacillus sp. J14TS2 TaxID=2807188 RepID=UPI001B26D94B|nr:hypothetical protein [Bacillus sp. J14TS2]GIN69643.1 hypothetical protein J14TS2_01180 [Bacillus sp. J14TS2]